MTEVEGVWDPVGECKGVISGFVFGPLPRSGSSPWTSLLGFERRSRYPRKVLGYDYGVGAGARGRGGSRRDLSVGL